MIKEIEAFEPFSFDGKADSEQEPMRRSVFFEFLDLYDLVIVSKPIRYNTTKVCRATGMSFSELNKLLTQHGFSADSKYVSPDAMEVLEEWYLKKLKRYVRNGLALDNESADQALFVEFCIKYRKIGHDIVLSWRDIDEDRLRQDFRNECEGVISPEPFVYRKGTLFAAIYSSYLFRLRSHFSKHTTITESIISYIISHRYHIFTSEEGSNADENQTRAMLPIIQWLNPPRSATKYGLAS